MATKKTTAKAKKGRLLAFHGTECPHCRTMDPLIDRLEKELGVKVDKIEVWHNERNAQILQEYDKGYCGGVPFFFNEASGEWLCGEADYDSLKKWALRKK